MNRTLNEEGALGSLKPHGESAFGGEEEGEEGALGSLTPQGDT